MSTPKKSKAQLVRELKKALDLVRARDEQIADMKWHVEKVVELRAQIEQLEARLETGNEKYQDMNELYKKKCGQLITLEGELREKSTELVNVRRMLTEEREQHIRTQRRNEEKHQRIGALEKLLVHNGKAIGALTELAADKFKNDELPF